MQPVGHVHVMPTLRLPAYQGRSAAICCGYPSIQGKRAYNNKIPSLYAGDTHLVIAIFVFGHQY